MNREVKTVKISDLKRDWQIRESLNDEAIKDYADAIERDDRFAPAEVTRIGEELHVGDGNHRVEARLSLGLTEIEVIITDGDKRSLIITALRKNREHGVQLTTADKRKAIRMLLELSEGGDSDRSIAVEVGCHHSTVSNVRREWESESEQVDKLSTCEDSDNTKSAEIISDEDEIISEEVQTNASLELDDKPSIQMRKGRDGRDYPEKPKPLKQEPQKVSGVQPSVRNAEKQDAQSDPENISVTGTGLVKETVAACEKATQAKLNAAGTISEANETVMSELQVATSEVDATLRVHQQAVIRLGLALKAKKHGVSIDEVAAKMDEYSDSVFTLLRRIDESSENLAGIPPDKEPVINDSANPSDATQPETNVTSEVGSSVIAMKHLEVEIKKAAQGRISDIL